jgi:hypothetical protein
MLHDTADNLVVHLHETEASHIQHVFTWRPYVYKLSMKVSFHSCITHFCTLYTIHQKLLSVFVTTLYLPSLQIYWISSRGQPTRGVPPAWGLGVELTTPHHKNLTCYEMFQSTSDLDWFFGMT